MENLKRTIFGFLALSLLLVLLAPAVAVAQDREGEPPLRLVYLNTAGNDGNSSYRAIENILQQSEQIELLRNRDFLRLAADFMLDEESFRLSDLRRENIDIFEALMRQADVEGILIHDVFARGNTLQIVVIGPLGFEIADIRQTIQRGRIDDDQTLVVLREVFTSLVPEVRGYRRLLEEKRQQAEEEERLRVEEKEAISLREQAVADHRARRGFIKPNLALRVGPLMGHRSMRLDEIGGDFSLHHLTPLLGVGLRVNTVVATFEDGTSGMAVNATVGYSPFTTAFGATQLQGQYMRVGADARYIHVFSSTLQAQFFGGLELMNLFLESNDQYTGHSYLTARSGLGMYYSFGSLMNLRVDAVFLPILHTTNSGGAYGETPSWFGLGSEVGLDLSLLEPLLISLDYSFQRFALDYPDPSTLDRAAQSVDMIHQVMITIGYRI